VIIVLFVVPSIYKEGSRIYRVIWLISHFLYCLILKNKNHNTLLDIFPLLWKSINHKNIFINKWQWQRKHYEKSVRNKKILYPTQNSWLLVYYSVLNIRLLRGRTLSKCVLINRYFYGTAVSIVAYIFHKHFTLNYHAKQNFRIFNYYKVTYKLFIYCNQ